MPCNSDYLKPTQIELEISRVACLLDELDGRKINKDHWDGYHPRVYNKFDKNIADKLTKELCSRLQKDEVSKYSLEMQIWWRDHQEADKKRLKKEIAARKTEKAKKAALAKLTPYERKILNLN